MPALLHFSELQAGQNWRSSTRTLSEIELDLFTMLTGDRHPLHADAHAAAGGLFGGRIFHGSFGIALTVAMCTTLPELHEPVVAATGISEWKFLAPLMPGDTVHATARVLEARVSGNGRRGVLMRELRLVRHDGQVAQQGVSGLMVELGRSGLFSS